MLTFKRGYEGRMRVLESVRRVALESEEALLGFERSPPKRVLERSRWMPDVASAYCALCGASNRRLQQHCSVCQDAPLQVERVVRLGAYRSPLSDWICEVKFARWYGMGDVLGRMLGRAVSARCFSAEFRPDLIVPVPMPMTRRLLRGIDHAGVLASGAAAELGVPVARPLYQVSGHTQVSRTPSQRERRRNPFFPRRFKSALRGRRVLLVDDVLTSGRTARAMARAVRCLGASKVVLGVLAVTERT